MFQIGRAEEAEPVRGLSEGHREGRQVRLPEGEHLQAVGEEGEVLRGAQTVSVEYMGIWVHGYMSTWVQEYIGI